MPDSTIPAEWFAQGDLDIQAAEILLAQNGPLTIVRDADFARFLAACQRITEYYIEARYPIGVMTPFQPAALQADLTRPVP